MSEFYPKVWLLHESSNNILSPDRRMSIATLGGYGYLTGLCKGVPVYSSKEAWRMIRANARLIQAAPEMYECLMQIVNGILRRKTIKKLLARIDGEGDMYETYYSD